MTKRWLYNVIFSIVFVTGSLYMCPLALYVAPTGYHTDDTLTLEILYYSINYFLFYVFFTMTLSSFFFSTSLPSKPKVFVIAPPPLYPPFPYDMNVTVINEIFPVLLREIATIGNTNGVIDVFSALGGAALTQPGITCDGCHPINPGYLEAAQTIFVTLANMAEANDWPKPVQTPGLSYPENYSSSE